jgi:cytochrome P450/NADPH-cytochrome P450 reductase
MLYGRDPVTGQGLSDENIRFQLVTFLIAGHEVS